MVNMEVKKVKKHKPPSTSIETHVSFITFNINYDAAIQQEMQNFKLNVFIRIKTLHFFD